MLWSIQHFHLSKALRQTLFFNKLFLLVVQALVMTTAFSSSLNIHRDADDSISVSLWSSLKSFRYISRAEYLEPAGNLTPRVSFSVCRRHSKWSTLSIMIDQFIRQVQTQMSNLQKSVNNLQGYAGLEIVASGELAQRPDLTIAFAVADAANEGKFRHFTNSSHNTS